MQHTQQPVSFTGGGEMGKLIQQKDWSETPLGNIDHWPINLQLVNRMMLHAPTPTLICWSADCVTLFNDSFAHLLNGRITEPAIPGQPLKEMWPEAWQVMKTDIVNLFTTGTAFKAEDMGIPLLRDGKLSDAYWNYSGTPIFNAEGLVDGLLLNLGEMTSILNTRKELEVQDQRFRNFMREAPVGIIILIGQDMVVSQVNQSYADLIDRKPKDLLHRRLFDIIPEMESSFRPLLQQVMQRGEPVFLPEASYFVYVNGEKKQGFLNVIYQPYREKDGRITGVMAVCHDITQQIIARKKLEESELFSQSVFYNSPVAKVVFTGEDMVIRTVNENMLEMMGKDHSIIGKPFMEAVPELQDTPLLDRLRNVLSTGTTFVQPEEKLTLLKEGNPYIGYYNYIYKALRNTDGEIYGIMVTATDITENVTFRAELEKSEAKLRSIIAAAPAGIGLFVGRDLVIENPNSTFIDIVGKGDGIAGLPLREAMPELVTEGQPFLQILDDVYTTGKMFQSFGSLVKIVQQGVMKYNYYNITYTPIFDENNEVYAILDVATDVTEQINAQHALERSESKVRSLIESAPFPIGVFEGRDLHIIIANQSMLDAWGKGNGVIGKRYPVILPELKETPILQQLDDVLTTGIAFHAKNIRVDLVIHGVMEIRYFNYSFTPVLDEKGNVYAVMNTAADVTDLNLAKQKIEENELLLQTKVLERTASLEKANEELVSTNRELEEFSYAASHDMQEPLRKVLTFTDILQQNFSDGLSDKGKEYLGKIMGSVNRMRKIIDGLLEYSHQVNEGQLFLRTDLNTVLADIQSDLDLSLVEKNATVKTDRLPEIDAVPAQMQQLFYNLFSNAIKFSKSGVSLEITIKTAIVVDEEIKTLPKPPEGTAYLAIIFSDNGIGFDQQYASHIFSIFKRLHGKETYAGTGIGLALCKKAVENHHGFISAFSTEGEGANFRILLPVKHEDLAALGS